MSQANTLRHQTDDRLHFSGDHLGDETLNITVQALLMKSSPSNPFSSSDCHHAEDRTRIDSLPQIGLMRHVA
jgi:hypothetical protein